MTHKEKQAIVRESITNKHSRRTAAWVYKHGVLGKVDIERMARERAEKLAAREQRRTERAK